MAELKFSGTISSAGIATSNSSLISEIRNYPYGSDVNVYIFVAHTTGVNRDCVEEMFDTADIITACASKAISEYTDEHKPYYYGNKVPIFCGSDEGRRLLDNRLEKIGKPLSNNNYPRNKEDMPHELL